jgi:hypothetical protein
MGEARSEYILVYIRSARHACVRRATGIRTKVDDQGEEAAVTLLAAAAMLRVMGEYAHTSE